MNMKYSDLSADELRFLDAWHNATPAAQRDAWLILNHAVEMKQRKNAEAEPAEIVPFPSGANQHAEGDTNG